jgi:cell division septation protein DedD
MVTSLLGVFLGFGLNSMTGSSATQQGQINQLTQEIALLKNVFQTARIAQFNGSGAAVTFQAPEVKSSPKPTPSPTLTPKATPSSTASKKTTTPDTKTTPSPVEGAKCDTKKDTKKIKNLECVNGKWVGKDAFSEGKPSDSSTGTN